MLFDQFGSTVVWPGRLRSTARVPDRRSTETWLERALFASGSDLEPAPNPYLAPALRAAAAARARTARIRAAQIGLAPTKDAAPVACSQTPTAAATAADAYRHPDGTSISPLPAGRFPRTMAEIERQLAASPSAAAAGIARRPARLSGDAGAPRASFWARVRSGLARWVFQ
jgi:hypothetical protein